MFKTIATLSFCVIALALVNCSDGHDSSSGSRLLPKESAGLLGGDGRCLFHSLREQIAEAELVLVKYFLSNESQALIANYETKSAEAKANVLRAIAIEVERNFVAFNPIKRFTELSNDDQASLAS